MALVELILYGGCMILVNTGTQLQKNRIDTACSSSLVALDLGCKDLRSGEANMVSTSNIAPYH